MAKYDFEFKKRVVLAYLNGEGSEQNIADRFGISHKSTVNTWVRCYTKEGDKGLLRSRQNKIYSFEYKCSIVELYLSSELSIRDIAKQENIHNEGIIFSWINRYRACGPDGLRPRKKGRKKTLDNTTKKTVTRSVEEAVIDTSAEHVKELEDELLKLRIENAFLKELRRLRLEDEAKMRDLHESSPVSGDNSN